MKWFSRQGNKVRLLGLSILSQKQQKHKTIYYLLGIRIFSRENNFINFSFNIHDEKLSFNTAHLDKKIKEWVDQNIYGQYSGESIKNRRIAILASELYDMGGHTEVIRNIVSGLPKDIETTIFLTRKKKSFLGAPKKILELLKLSVISGMDTEGFDEKKHLPYLLDKIIQFSPKAIVAFIHMDDALGAALLYLLKKHTNIKIIFCNHGSHYPSLGMSFADVIWEGTPTTERITQQSRGLNNTCVLGLPYLKEEDLPQFRAEDILNKKLEIGIPAHCLCTMSGGTSYKFFENKTSPYFEMIYQLLQKHQELYHVVITKFNQNQKEIISRIFMDDAIKKRLIILAPTAEYKLLFKCADVFIDSFPVSSALTQVDLMSLKVPSVVKINRDNPLWSFHEYLPAEYPYMFENVTEMQQAISQLLQDEPKRVCAAELNYRHFLNVFEGKKFVAEILKLIAKIEKTETSIGKQ